MGKRDRSVCVPAGLVPPATGQGRGHEPNEWARRLSGRYVVQHSFLLAPGGELNDSVRPYRVVGLHEGFFWFRGEPRGRVFWSGNFIPPEPTTRSPSQEPTSLTRTF